MLDQRTEADITAVISRWQSWSLLAGYALARHGYGIAGVWGVRYPNDLSACGDEPAVPEGHVYICGYWDSSRRFDHILPETAYLAVLVKALSMRKLKHEARSVAALQAALEPRRTADEMLLSPRD